MSVTESINAINDNLGPGLQAQANAKSVRAEGPAQQNLAAPPGIAHLYERLAQGDSVMAERDDIREEIKDKLAAAEARTETKITALNGKIDQVLTKIDGMNSRFGEIRTDVGARMAEIRSDVRDDGRATRANIWVAAAGLAAVVVALYAAFPGIVDYGMKLGEVRHAQEAPKAPAAKTP